MNGVLLVKKMNNLTKPNIKLFHICVYHCTNVRKLSILWRSLSSADPGGGGGTGAPDPPEKSQKIRVS